MEGGSKKDSEEGRDAEKGQMTRELKEVIRGESRKDKSVEEAEWEKKDSRLERRCGL